MNLNYVRNFLKEVVEQPKKEDIEKLIEQIDAYIGTEKKFEDIASIMRTVNEYNVSYLTQIQEYEILQAQEMSEGKIKRQLEKVRGILCTLSSLHTYLVLTRANISESTYNMKNIRSYLTDIDSKKEHYKSEKMTWATILRSLTQEITYIAEMRKMDLEDKIGYISGEKKTK